MPHDGATHILIVEDDPSIRVLYCHLLSKHFEVRIVSSIEDALKAALRKRFDLFLFDINLGEERTGVDLLQMMRQMQPYQATPAIACTAIASLGDRTHLLDKGFDVYLAKPFTGHELMTTIHVALPEASGLDDRNPARPAITNLPAAHATCRAAA